MRVENRAGLSGRRFDELAHALSAQHSIMRAVDWLAGHRPSLAPAEMETQDECSHDILVPYPDGLWIVYDST